MMGTIFLKDGSGPKSVTVHAVAVIVAGAATATTTTRLLTGEPEPQR
ncbi:hypothetical protein [Nocardia carnea]|uniref:Uncharacterized protein n=1 Tax=Nocardia carnea TaxID=37328 RepID=A0ABW7TZ09_9NOCA|nr:hypothetical protein [Nocardia carnea]